MEDTLTQAYTLVRAAVLAVVVVLALVALALDRRPRHLTPTLSVIRGLIALVGFAVLLVISGVNLSLLWSAIAAIAGAGLGYLSGRASAVTPGGGGSLTVKRTVWPMLVMMVGYALATFTLLYGTTGLFTAALLVVLLGTAMVVGASLAETLVAGIESATPAAGKGSASA